MIPQTDNPRLSSLGKYSKTAALAGSSIGGLALLGWVLKIPLLTGAVSGLVPMNPTTAVTLMMAGVSLGLLRRDAADPSMHLLGQALAYGVALIGGIRLIYYLTGVDLGIDRILHILELSNDGGAPSRMASTTALGFVLLGGALIGLNRPIGRGSRLSEGLFLAVFIGANLALLGYVYGVPLLYHLSSGVPMAVNTAIAFLLLSLAGLLARPDRGVMSVITAPDP
ncbi:MAG TPA: hypothetical protein VI702_06160, partial [Nitrospiria bacterium]